MKTLPATYLLGILIFIIFLYCLISHQLTKTASIPSTLNSKPTPGGREFRGTAVPLHWDNNPVQTVELFLNQTTDPGISIKDWFSDDKTIRDKYLDKLIYSDNIQSYPWMAANPGGATSFNNSLFRKSSIIPRFEEKPLTYYDFSEITYIGNPL